MIKTFKTPEMYLKTLRSDRDYWSVMVEDENGLVQTFHGFVSEAQAQDVGESLLTGSHVTVDNPLTILGKDKKSLKEKKRYTYLG